MSDWIRTNKAHNLLTFEFRQVLLSYIFWFAEEFPEVLGRPGDRIFLVYNSSTQLALKHNLVVNEFFECAT